MQHPEIWSGEPAHMYPFRVNREKALEVLFYISRRAPIPDKIHICKILYLADKYHMKKYARFICGDRYVAMQHGPVPSYVYDLIKAADQGEIPGLSVDDFAISADREPKLELFSKSDIEALNWAIREFGNLQFNTLVDMCHDDIWKEATNNGRDLIPHTPVKSIPIPLEGILSRFEDGDDLLEYLREYSAAL